MTNKWQDNQTWSSGLLSEIPVSRWKDVRGSKLVEILVFERRSDAPPHPGNLELRQILQANGFPMQKSIWDNPDKFFCVAVNMGLRTLPVECSFTTTDAVNGSVELHLDYQVDDSERVVVGIDDALASLSNKCRATVTELAEKCKHTDISTQTIKQTIVQMSVTSLGLTLVDVSIPNPIKWPSSIMGPLSKIPETIIKDKYDRTVSKLEIERQKEYVRLLESELRSMGITHPAMLTRILARHDPDYQTILDAAQHFAESQRDSQDKAKEFLVWLIEKDKVPRIELEELVMGLVGRVTDDVTALPDAVASLLTAPSDTKPQIAGSSTTVYTTTDTGSEDNEQMGIEQEETYQESKVQSHSVQRRLPKQVSDKKGKGHSVTRRPAKPQQND